MNVFETLSKIPTQIDVSSEFRYRDLLINKDTLVLAISQSGETADTLVHPVGMEDIFPAGKDLVGVSLVANVPDEGIFFQVQESVESDGQFHHAQV